MAKVIANERGYYGGMVREPGDRFSIPDEIMRDAKRRPSWVRLAAFGGKGDHDGDGLTGGSKPKGDGLQGMRIPELREIAERKGIDLTGITRKGDIIAAIEAGVETADEPESSEPFGEAPEPVSLAQAQKQMGGIEPDWIPPEHQAPQPIDD